MRLDRAWIERHIPHQGSMCLLDEVLDWDSERICCRSTTHSDAGHPLRAHGRLGIACGVEYAAQAMAVHGALLAGAGAPPTALPIGGGLAAVAAPTTVRPAAGFLASVRDLRFHASQLDDVLGDLICQAVRMAGDGATALYEFDVRSKTASLLSGRATVVLDANQRLKL